MDTDDKVESSVEKKDHLIESGMTLLDQAITELQELLRAHPTAFKSS